MIGDLPSYILTVLLLSVGFLFSAQTRLYQLRGFLPLMKYAAVSTVKHGGKAARSMLLSLGGTVGIGNIAGVAIALYFGGAGAVFWMWMCGILGMITKYAEVRLAVKHAPNGPFSYINDSFGKYGGIASVLFSIGCIASSLTVGNYFQVTAVTESAAGRGWSALPVAVILTAPIAVLAFSKGESIINFSGVTVPIMSIGYIILTSVIIIRHIGELPGVTASIFKGAFGADSAAAGMSASLLSAAIRQGVSKGLFSHEAGMGSSPISYAAAECDGKTAGAFSMLEVFLDTGVICTLTAFALLVTGNGDKSGITAARTMMLSEFGGMGDVFLSVSIVLFCISSVAGWLFYGRRAVMSLTKKAVPMFLYKLIFCITAAVSPTLPSDIMWKICDAVMLLTAVPNLFSLIKNKDIIIASVGKKDERKCLHTVCKEM